jgi:hypothetical protein
MPVDLSTRSGRGVPRNFRFAFGVSFLVEWRKKVVNVKLSGFSS